MSSPTAGNTTSNELTTDDFINHVDVLNCIARLETEFAKEKRPFIVSDVYDDEGNQYVNLVQKGGGVLGIALVGYTYILEKMGIRFVRLAGTSAGAINTALMTVIGDKKEAKSIQILKSICDLNFFNLVDGHPAAKWVIKKFITHEDFSVKVSKWLKTVLIIAVALLAFNFIFLGLQYKDPILSIATKISFVLTGLYFVMLGILIFYFARLLQRLKNSGFGINPGNFFYDWIKKLL